MELLNATGMQAGYTLGMQPDGRELLVVVVKGTFKIPKNGEDASLSEKQVPLIESDVFTGEPGLSAILHESDYAPRKPRCDVILNGSAYVPEGKYALKVTVLLRVAQISKSFNVVGDQVWKDGLLSIKSSNPLPFRVKPISYSNAFGGMDTNDPKNPRAYLLNPVGIGFHYNLKAEFIEGKPLPNTEEINNPVARPNGQYIPMSFGSIGRNFQSRIRFAGTYDQDWLDNKFPFLPPDFDEAYYQSAPLDQQIPYPRGGEEVILVNLTPEGRTQFRLPGINVPIEFNLRNWERKETEGVIDTVLIEPDESRFMLTWRASLPLRKNIFEVAQVVVGKMPRAWYRARETGKTYYPSLGELIKAKKRESVNA